MSSLCPSFSSSKTAALAGALLLGAALIPTGAGAAPPPADLDGDGKVDPVVLTAGKVQVGAASLECGYDGFICGVELVDVHPGDGRKELVICGEAPRLDRACELYVYESGALRLVPIVGQGERTLLDALKITAPGNGHLMVEGFERLYTRLDKYQLDAQRAGLHLVAQPFQLVSQETTCEGQLTLSLEPRGGPKVASTLAGSKVMILLESGVAPGQFLIRSTSGLLGWTGIDALVGACEPVRMTYSAG